jgi:hypothetical protein
MSSNNAEYCWPADFPEGIPEELDVIPAEGKVYRLVKNTPPTEDDFLMHRVEYPRYKYSQNDIPKSYGVSFWTRLSRIQRIRKNYPKPEQFGGRVVVSGELCGGLGVIPSEVARDGHVTLWTQEGAKPHLHINNIEDEQ